MSDQTRMRLSHQHLDYALGGDQGLRALRYGIPQRQSWLNALSENPVFAVYVDGGRVDGAAEGLSVQQVHSDVVEGGARHSTAHLEYAPGRIEIKQHTLVYPRSTLIEQWINVRNTGDRTVRIDRLDSICIDVRVGQYDLMSFTGGWGSEFEPVVQTLHGGTVLESRAGRSSNGQHPWFALFGPDEEVLSASVMWSGNWVMRFEPLAVGGYRISGGLNDWEFFKDLATGEAIESPHVAVVLGRDLNLVSKQYAQVGRQHWYPSNDLSSSLPVEWNHWWSYEDRQIDETVFKQNVDEAARLGILVCTLDAGWFGPTDPESHWYDYRGDWDQVNTLRFPSGLQSLAEYTHSRGLRLGLWCEIEGLGERAQLVSNRPDLVARRDDERLGYVCFGNPSAGQWAFEMLNRWIKLDFNLDPGAGCNRLDHEHGAGDGLYEHYRGYYKVLQRVRERHPDVILENCSSGGLRTELGIMQQTHTSFLSDPDWPEHDLQLFWAASTMLAPEVCLHRSWSEWLTEHPRQTFNPRDPDLKPHQLDYYVRISMLGGFGFSQKLPELPEWVADRLDYHIRMYREQAAPFVRCADVYRLTNQAPTGAARRPLGGVPICPYGHGRSLAIRVQARRRRTGAGPASGSPRRGTHLHARLADERQRREENWS